MSRHDEDPVRGRGVHLPLEACTIEPAVLDGQRGAAVLVDADYGAIVLTLDGQALALRLTSYDDAAKLTLACLALASKLAERDAATAAQASQALDRIAGHA